LLNILHHGLARQANERVSNSNVAASD
jgi:hypothetical protein